MLEVFSLPIDSVHCDPANVRRHPARNLDAIKASLARFGQQKPILIDASNVVRAGNGTVEAARALGWTEIRCVRTDLIGSEATAYAIADNRTAELAEWDDHSLAAVLGGLVQEEFPIEEIGFTDAELAELLPASENGQTSGDPVDDPESEWSGMPGFEHGDLSGVRSIIVHFKAHEDVADFARLMGQNISDRTRFIWYPAQAREPYGEAE